MPSISDDITHNKSSSEMMIDKVYENIKTINDIKKNEYN